jgi:[ribosomal protein S18]-alanine N-acetyltransferase
VNLRGTIEIRAMTQQDLDEVLQIEGLSFPAPWSRTLFERELSTPFARAFVAQEAQRGKILGYLCFWLVEQEAHILNLAVHPEHRNRGIGTLLLSDGVSYCRKGGVQVITLEVRRSNYKAISLYRGFHFQPLGIRRRYYTDSGEDAVVMGLVLGETTSLSTV